MAKIIDFTEYKDKKDIKAKCLSKEKEHENRYLEYYINMDEEERKMINSWLLED